ncbi:hypothetical protein [Kingella oralis]
MRGLVDGAEFVYSGGVNAFSGCLWRCADFTQSRLLVPTKGSLKQQNSPSSQWSVGGSPTSWQSAKPHPMHYFLR